MKSFWIARDKDWSDDADDLSYYFYRLKKDIKFDPEDGIVQVMAFHTEKRIDFEYFFGVKLKPGEIKKYRMVEVK